MLYANTVEDFFFLTPYKEHSLEGFFTFVFPMKHLSPGLWFTSYRVHRAGTKRPSLQNVPPIKRPSRKRPTYKTFSPPQNLLPAKRPPAFTHICIYVRSVNT